MSSPSPSCWQGHLGCAGPVSSHAVRGAGSADSSQARKLRGRGGGETSGLQAATHGCLLPSPAPGLGGGTLAGEKGTTLEPQVAQAQLEKQAGPVVAETATGRGNGRRRRAGSHSRVLASATRGGLVVGTSDGPQEGGGRLLGPSQACGPSVHVAWVAICPIGLMCRWAGFSTKVVQETERGPCILVNSGSVQSRGWPRVGWSLLGRLSTAVITGPWL